MFEYSFTLVIEGDVDPRIDELFEAGCDDATFGSVDGVNYADFDREAETFGRAIRSALADVESVPGLVVRRVEPDDLVTASEIAERLGRSRESVRLLIAGERGAGDFPAPVSHLRSRNRLWRWSDVAEWAGSASRSEVDRARLVAAFNAALELRAKVPDLPEETREALGSLSKSKVPA
jgi:predicted DNA-binding transcriptional regulator AlpA